jgi:hypothetical protein
VAAADVERGRVAFNEPRGSRIGRYWRSSGSDCSSWSSRGPVVSFTGTEQIGGSPDGSMVEVVARSAVVAFFDAACGIESEWDTESSRPERAPPACAELGVA